MPGEQRSSVLSQKHLVPGFVSHLSPEPARGCLQGRGQHREFPWYRQKWDHVWELGTKLSPSLLSGITSGFCVKQLIHKTWINLD